MRAAFAALAGFVAGACFEPAPQEGFACSPDNWCPGPLFCAADHICRSADVTGDGGPAVPSNLAFVTSKAFLASELGSLARADNECMNAAAAANLSGRYVAWLSVMGQPARDRLGTASGWRRTDGKPFVRDFFSLRQGNNLYPLRKTERGDDLSGTVLTGTDDQGNPTGNDCRGLTSSSPSDVISTGESTGGTSLWTIANDTPCDQQGHLYCLQIDYQQSVVPAHEPGPLAFLSTPSPPMGGLDGADAHCMDEAGLAGIAGTFRALLSTTTVAALDRFQPLPSTPWVRLDDVATTRDFVTWDAPINVTVGGNYPNLPTYSGAVSPTKKSASANESCNDWTGGTSALLGNAASASPAAFGSTYATEPPICIGESSVFCLQVP
jgi:hypothetical protein